MILYAYSYELCGLLSTFEVRYKSAMVFLKIFIWKW